MLHELSVSFRKPADDRSSIGIVDSLQLVMCRSPHGQWNVLFCIGGAVGTVRIERGISKQKGRISKP